MKEFEGKVALVTGASSGIGKSIAKLYAKMGAKVVVSDVDDAGAQETVNSIQKEDGEAIYIHVRRKSSYGRIPCRRREADRQGQGSDPWRETPLRSIREPHLHLPGIVRRTSREQFVPQKSPSEPKE